MDELSNCPFCGGQSRLYHLLGGYNFVQCEKCGARGPDHYSKEKAEEAWSKRYDPVNFGQLYDAVLHFVRDANKWAHDLGFDIAFEEEKDA